LVVFGLQTEQAASDGGVLLFEQIGAYQTISSYFS